MEGTVMIKGIIVEGCDCAGKSTLVKMLKVHLSDAGWDVVDLGHKQGNQFERYIKHYVQTDRAIFDRGHFSEIVYANAWRGGHDFKTWELNALNEYALEHFIVVFAHVPPDVLKMRYQERNYKQIILFEELEKIQSSFAQTLQDPRVITYQATNNKALEDVICTIKSRLNKKITANIMREAR
jgi:thymidylate kinase